jgi:hypothetical protein
MKADEGHHRGMKVCEEGYYRGIKATGRISKALVPHFFSRIAVEYV